MLVAGGGVAGAAAALRAAEEGLSVILIESRNSLGQELTATYQSPGVAKAPADSTPLAQASYAELTPAGVLTNSDLDPLRLGPPSELISPATSRRSRRCRSRASSTCWSWVAQADIAGRAASGELSVDLLHRQDFWREERGRQFPPDRPTRSLEQAVERLGTVEPLEAMAQIYRAGEEAVPRLRPLLESQNRPAREEAAVLLALAGDRSADRLLLAQYRVPSVSFQGIIR